ncbi:mantle protein-like [Wyeomyia smithii]|uniref:mantle protein-like n=1 Tax=Wyeomyia smithii TaxID=174621 RepID=UPI002467E9E4|nr:mantle protein-like [Wyeomyia smithii]
MRIIALVGIFVLVCEANIVPVDVKVPIKVPVLDIKHVENVVSPVREVKVPVIKQVAVEHTVPHFHEVPYIKKVPVEHEVKVFRDVEVVREVPVEKVVHKRVEVPVPVIREVELIREVPVVQEIPHVKVVKVVKEVPVEEVVHKDVYVPETHAVKVPIHVPVIKQEIKQKPSKLANLLHFDGFFG